VILEEFPIDTATLPLSGTVETQHHRLLFLRSTTDLPKLRGPNAAAHYERTPRFRRSKLDMATSSAGWSEPVSGRESHPLKSSAFRGALFRQR
jgi:hypothetical protein